MSCGKQTEGSDACCARESNFLGRTMVCELDLALCDAAHDCEVHNGAKVTSARELLASMAGASRVMAGGLERFFIGANL